MTTGWKALVKILTSEKVKLVFGLVGGAHEFWDCLADTDIKPIHVRHELSSVFMAMAYARLTGEPGIPFNSPGPGAASMIPGILEAYTGCIPLVIPSPCSHLMSEGMGQFQEADMMLTTKSMTKWSFRVTRPERITWAMQRAFSLAINGKPGPVFIEIPYDIGDEECEIPEYKPPDRPLRIRGDPDRIGKAIDLILEAERPIIQAGGGVILSKAFNELRNFAELLGIPVVTTASGRGSIPEGHPLALGLVGLYRTRVGRKLYEEADLLIGIGSKNEEIQTAGWKYFPKGAKFIQIDIDPFEIGRNWKPNLAIVGDAKLVLKDLTDNIASKIKKGRIESPRVKELIKAKKEYEAIVESECQDVSVPIKPRRIVRELNKVFGRNTILANENGMSDSWSYFFPYYKVLDAGDCMGMPEQTCFGLGVVGAIGAKLTRPDKKVVCTTGDGAFQWNMKEIPTAVQYNAPVTWVVMNNYSLGWEKYIQRYAFDGRCTATEFDVQPDFVKIAEANKCYGERVEDPRQVELALKNALKANVDGTPAILDFVVDLFDRPEFWDESNRQMGWIPTR